jgi:hypothetical protein
MGATGYRVGNCQFNVENNKTNLSRIITLPIEYKKLLQIKSGCSMTGDINYLEYLKYFTSPMQTIANECNWIQ